MRSTPTPDSRPLCPQKRTLELNCEMSALCQQRTLPTIYSINSSAAASSAEWHREAELLGGHCGQMQRQWIFESALFANTIIFSATISVMASLRSLKPRRRLRRT
jgi:hypothetical protein